MKAEDLMVYAITDRYWLNGAKLADQVEDVLKNGATFLQLREKSFTHEEMVAEAKERGVTRCIVPAENQTEALLVKEIEIFAVQSIAEMIHILNGAV